MIKAVAHHIWLMLTFRHKGTGLPRSKDLVAVLFAISMLFDWFVFSYDAVRLMVDTALSVLVVTYYDAALISAAALITIGIGTIALPFVMALGHGVLPVFNVWGLIVAVYMGVRIVMRKEQY